MKVMGLPKFNAPQFLIGLLCLTYSLSGCESGRDNDRAHKIMSEVIEPVLIKNNICSDFKDCQIRYVAHYGISNGAHWTIYGMKDRQINNEILSNFLHYTKWLPKNKTYSISIYSVSEQEVGFFEKPIVQLLIQGEQPSETHL